MEYLDYFPLKGERILVNSALLYERSVDKKPVMDPAHEEDDQEPRPITIIDEVLTIEAIVLVTREAKDTATPYAVIDWEKGGIHLLEADYEVLGPENVSQAA